MKLLFVYFSAIFITTFVTECDGYIKCYSCQSTHDNRCGDYFQFQAYDALECQGTCIKRRGRRSGSGVEITRECVIQTNERCYDTTYDGISVEACTCNSDYCNTAVYVGRKTSILSITTITTLYLQYVLIL